MKTGVVRGWSFALSLKRLVHRKALLFIRIAKQFVPPFRDQASSEESASYLALAGMRLWERVMLIGPWDEHCPQATCPWPGPAVPQICRRACPCSRSSSEPALQHIWLSPPAGEASGLSAVGVVQAVEPQHQFIALGNAAARISEADLSACGGTWEPGAGKSGCHAPLP